MEDSLTLNIVFLPDEATREKAIEMSRKVAENLPVEFVLGQGTIPHITIYQAMFPNKNLGKVKGIIRDLASKMGPFQVEMGQFWVNAVRGFVWWNCLKTDQLSEIHWKFIKETNNLREGLIPDSLKAYRIKGEQDKMEIKNYGALFAGARYTPHLTITALKNPDDEQKAYEILGKEKESLFTVDKISLGSLGPYGTVTGIIEEFPIRLKIS